MADTEPSHTVTLTDAEVPALRSAMSITFSECEGVPVHAEMLSRFPGIRAKLDAAQGAQEESR